MGHNATSYSKVIKIEGDYIRRTPFEAEDVDKVEDFDVKKYKIAGDLWNPRISFYGFYDESDDDDYDDDDYDDEPVAVTSKSKQPAGDYYTPAQLAAIVDAAVARAVRVTTPRVVAPMPAPMPVAPRKSWRGSINA